MKKLLRQVVDLRLNALAAALPFALWGCQWIVPPAIVCAQPPAAAIDRIYVEPAEIILRGDNRGQQLLVTAEGPDARPFDVTRRAQIECDNLQVATIIDGVALGVADGRATVRVVLDGMEAMVPVRVEGFASYPPVDFANDVLPLLSKLGCNNGGCHGKASGQNGFKLSVFGFDPGTDYDALVKQARGRRVFLASPEHSLLLTKPTGRAPHGGGQRLDVGSADYQLLLAWLRQGVPRAQAGSPALVGLTVSPRERVLELGSQQQILATAHFADGSLRDVTAAASYTSNAPGVIEVSPRGLTQTGQSPGEAAVTVHYMEQVASVQLQAPRPGGAVDLAGFAINNAIDELVLAKLKKMNLAPSDLADDATFLRRAWLDTIGSLPTPDEIREFLADSAPDKRARWIDRLLERPEYADYWALIWADILLVDRQKLGERGAYELHRWLREQFAQNRPYDQWVRELVSASGNSGLSGPANLFRAVETPDELARAISQAFLGVRIECAQCHHHPFEKWSQDDFYGLAGFFNGIERKPIAPGRVLVFHAGLRETRIPLTNKLVPTKPLDGEPPSDLAGGDPRLPLARWLTAPQNPWFARLVANRLWKHFLGRGVVEPEDDLRTTNPPTNEPLLTMLAERTVTADFDLKALMRLILNSRTYQLSDVPNATNLDDEQNFSHRYVKRMPAETLLDAIGQVTGEPELFPGRPRGTRAVELWDNRLPSYFLEIFGRPERTSPCECGRSSEPTMTQALHLMNAPEVESKLTSETGRVARLVAAGAGPDAILEDLCLAALGRFPGEREKSVARELFAAAPPRQAAEDLLWTLLNSYDFLFVK